MYEFLCHLRVRLGQQPNTGQVAKNKLLGCTSQANAADFLRQAKVNQSKLEKHSCFKGKLTLALIRESSSQGWKKDKNMTYRWGVFLSMGSLGKQERCVGLSWLAKTTFDQKSKNESIWLLNNMAKRHYANRHKGKRYHAKRHKGKRYHTNSHMAKRHHANSQKAKRHHANNHMAKRHHANNHMAKRHHANRHKGKRHHANSHNAKTHHANSRNAKKHHANKKPQNILVPVLHVLFVLFSFALP